MVNILDQFLSEWIRSLSDVFCFLIYRVVSETKKKKKKLLERRLLANYSYSVQFKKGL